MFAHSVTFSGACKTFSKCLFMTLTRLIYKNNLRQENNGAVIRIVIQCLYLPEGFLLYHWQLRYWQMRIKKFKPFRDLAVVYLLFSTQKEYKYNLAVIHFCLISIFHVLHSNWSMACNNFLIQFSPCKIYVAKTLCDLQSHIATYCY